jgi:hypothetical protein
LAAAETHQQRRKLGLCHESGGHSRMAAFDDLTNIEE